MCDSNCARLLSNSGIGISFAMPAEQRKRTAKNSLNVFFIRSPIWVAKYSIKSAQFKPAQVITPPDGKFIIAFYLHGILE
jgi:hypothetical protein